MNLTISPTRWRHSRDGSAASPPGAERDHDGALTVGWLGVLIGIGILANIAAMAYAAITLQAAP